MLGSNVSDIFGDFIVQGFTSEISHIDPILKIYHNCDDEWKAGKRRWKMNLPRKYIETNGQTHVLDIGTLNLEPIIGKEERDFF